MEWQSLKDGTLIDSIKARTKKKKKKKKNMYLNSQTIFYWKIGSFCFDGKYREVRGHY